MTVKIPAPQRSRRALALSSKLQDGLLLAAAKRKAAFTYKVVKAVSPAKRPVDIVVRPVSWRPLSKQDVNSRQQHAVM